MRAPEGIRLLASHFSPIQDHVYGAGCRVTIIRALTERRKDELGSGEAPRQAIPLSECSRAWRCFDELVMSPMPVTPVAHDFRCEYDGQ